MFLNVLFKCFQVPVPVVRQLVTKQFLAQEGSLRLRPPCLLARSLLSRRVLRVPKVHL